MLSAVNFRYELHSTQMVGGEGDLPSVLRDLSPPCCILPSAFLPTVIAWS